MVADAEAVVHGPPAVAGVGVRDAPPARAADVELQALRRGCIGGVGGGSGSEKEEDDAGEGQHGEKKRAGAVGSGHGSCSRRRRTAVRARRRKWHYWWSPVAVLRIAWCVRGWSGTPQAARSLAL